MRPTLARKDKKKKARRGGFRKRARSAGRRIGRAARRFRARRPHLGLLGKTGVAVAGAVPVVWGAIEASEPWLNPQYAQLPISSKLRHTVARFVNNLSFGFGVGTVFNGTDGGIAYSANTHLSDGTAWIKTTTVGLTFVVTDFITGALFKFTGKSVPRTKIMGRQLLTG